MKALALGLFALLGLVACASEPAVVPEITPEPTAAAKPVVRSLSWPVSWLVERLAGEDVDHACVLPPDADPSSWRPSGDLVAELGGVDLIVANGAGYEPWIATASLPRTKLVDSTRGLTLIEHDVQTHSHGPGGEHSHGEIDPRTFTDPTLFGRQATRVAAGLKTIVDDDAAVEERLGTVQAELEALGQEWSAALPALGAGHADRAWSYLFARVGKKPHAHGAPTLTAEHLAPIARPDGGDYDYLARSRAALAEVSR